jgi:O-antigen ligase
VKGLLFTFALTYGGSAAAIFKPWYGFLVYVMFAIIKPDAKWGFALPPWRYSLTIALALLLGWVLAGCGNWNFGRGKAVVWCLLGFWVWLLVSAALASDQAIAWHQATEMSKTFLCFLVGVTLVDSVEKLKQLAWVIVIAQGYLAFEFNVQYYTTLFISHEWKYGGLDNNGIAITMVTVIGLAFLLGMHTANVWAKFVAFGCAALMAHVVLFSDSRGGMLALCVTGFVTFLLIPKTAKHYLGFALAVALVLRLAGEGVQKEFATIFASDEQRDESSSSRTELWKACAQSMLQTPLGLGPNHWKLHAHEFGFNEGKAAHTTWLEVGAELGVPGLAFLLAFYWIGAWRLWRITRLPEWSVPDPWLQYLARAVVASFAGFFVSAQFVSVQGVETSYYIYVIAVGVLMLSTNAFHDWHLVPPADQRFAVDRGAQPALT